MSKGEKKFIHIILMIIAIASCILLIKIKKTPEYDADLYARVYSEYRSIFEKKDAEITNSNENNDNQNDNIDNSSYEDNEDFENNYVENNIVTNNDNSTYKTVIDSNQAYTIEGEIMIPKIKLVYPIISETTDEYLKIAPTKLAGPNMNEVGNYCIAGHNYQNNQFFSKISQLEINDQINLTSKNGKKLTYVIYAMYEVNENDLSCTNQNTNGNIEATLITCTTQKQKRLIIKCRA